MATDSLQVMLEQGVESSLPTPEAAGLRNAGFLKGIVDSNKLDSILREFAAQEYLGSDSEELGKIKQQYIQGFADEEVINVGKAFKKDIGRDPTDEELTKWIEQAESKYTQKWDKQYKTLTKSIGNRERFLVDYVAKNPIFQQPTREQVQANLDKLPFKLTRQQSLASLLRNEDVPDEERVTIAKLTAQDLPDEQFWPQLAASVRPETVAKITSSMAEDRTGDVGSGEGYGLLTPLLAPIMGATGAVTGAVGGAMEQALTTDEWDPDVASAAGLMSTGPWMAPFALAKMFPAVEEGITQGVEAGLVGRTSYPLSPATVIRREEDKQRKAAKSQVFDKIEKNFDQYKHLSDNEIVDLVDHLAEYEHTKNLSTLESWFFANPGITESMIETVVPIPGLGLAAKGAAKGAKGATRAVVRAAQSDAAPDAIRQAAEGATKSFSAAPFRSLAPVEQADQMLAAPMRGRSVAQQAEKVGQILKPAMHQYNKLSAAEKTAVNRAMLSKKAGARSKLSPKLRQVYDGFNEYRVTNQKMRQALGMNVVVDLVPDTADEALRLEKTYAKNFVQDLARKTNVSDFQVKRLLNRVKEGGKGGQLAGKKLRTLLNKELGSAEEIKRYDAALDALVDRQILKTSKQAPKKGYVPNLRTSLSTEPLRANITRDVGSYRQRGLIDPQTLDLADAFAKHAARFPQKAAAFAESKTFTQIASEAGHLQYFANPAAVSDDVAEVTARYLTDKADGAPMAVVNDTKKLKLYAQLLGEKQIPRIEGGSALVVPSWVDKSIDHALELDAKMLNPGVWRKYIQPTMRTAQTIMSGGLIGSKMMRPLVEMPSNLGFFIGGFGSEAAVRNFGNYGRLFAAELSGSANVANKLLSKTLKLGGREMKLSDAARLAKSYDLGNDLNRFDFITDIAGTAPNSYAQANKRVQQVARVGYEITSLGGAQVTRAGDNAARMTAFIEALSRAPDLTPASVRKAVVQAQDFTFYMGNMSRFNRGASDVLFVHAFVSKTVPASLKLMSENPEFVGKTMQLINTWRFENGGLPIFDERDLAWDRFGSLNLPLDQQPEGYRRAVETGDMLSYNTEALAMRIDGAPGSWMNSGWQLMESIMDGDVDAARRSLGPAFELSLQGLTGITEDGQELPLDLWGRLAEGMGIFGDLVKPEIWRTYDEYQQLKSMLRENAAGNYIGLSPDFLRLQAALMRRMRVGVPGTQLTPSELIRRAASQTYTRDPKRDTARSLGDAYKGLQIEQKLFEREISR